MIISKKKVFSFLSILLVFFSLISYEKNLYKYYSIFQIVILAITFLFLLLFLKYERELINEKFTKLKNNKTILIIFLMLFFMILHTTIASLRVYASIKGIVSVCGMVISGTVLYLLIPLLDVKYNNIKKNILATLNWFCMILVFMGLLIYFKKNIFGYSLIYGRVASIYYDANFLAMVLAINTIFIIFNNKMLKMYKLFFVPLSIFVIVLTGSRGTLLGLLISIIIYLFFFSKLKLEKKIIFISFFLLAAYIFVDYLNSLDFFRLYQGSNGRVEMIKYAIEMIKKSPIIGYGYSNISTYLTNSGFQNVSTHNSFVDFFFSFGVLPTFLFIIVIINSVVNALKSKKNPEMITALIFMLFNMNTILYNFGGVGISSLLFTVVLGFINIYNMKEYKHENKYNCSNL